MSGGDYLTRDSMAGDSERSRAASQVPLPCGPDDCIRIRQEFPKTVDMAREIRGMTNVVEEKLRMKVEQLVGDLPSNPEEDTDSIKRAEEEPAFLHVMSDTQGDVIRTLSRILNVLESL